MTEHPFKAAITAVADAMDADILSYFGDINEEGANEVCSKLNRKRKNILFILGTRGGDPNAAYRIARRIQRVYDTRGKYKGENDSRFFLYLPTICKSAGTLIALGADKIFISKDAEVGPIDIQIRKHDEVGERASGLLPSEAIDALSSRARQSFLNQFTALRTDRNLPFSTKLAAEVASNMTVGLFKPIFEQIDPLRLAEMERSQRIAAEYGERLSVGNLKEGSLFRLLGDYPSHSFIIDSDEMKDIFHSVAEADAPLERLSDRIEVLYKNFTGNSAPLVLHLDADQWSNEEDKDENGNDEPERADGAPEREAVGDNQQLPQSTDGGEREADEAQGGESPDDGAAKVVKITG